MFKLSGNQTTARRETQTREGEGGLGTKMGGGGEGSFLTKLLNECQASEQRLEMDLDHFQHFWHQRSKVN